MKERIKKMIEKYENKVKNVELTSDEILMFIAIKKDLEEILNPTLFNFTVITRRREDLEIVYAVEIKSIDYRGVTLKGRKKALDDGFEFDSKYYSFLHYDDKEFDYLLTSGEKTIVKELLKN